MPTQLIDTARVHLIVPFSALTNNRIGDREGVGGWGGGGGGGGDGSPCYLAKVLLHAGFHLGGRKGATAPPWIFCAPPPLEVIGVKI